ncbi:Zn(II)2Cys6 transcription factor domain-containing protein [Sporobolomyces koalae]|uniref:Zn(II)2Cys6 transcription factor domain-containing protein n=1 Tax=Sporobolomyces koalae TaxID=500713 RepID=UPI0031812B6C
MTPPIPLGHERKRPSKSCLPCRKAKAKCLGLSEQYLQLFEDPDFDPATLDDQPKCARCRRQKLDCEFEPSRRKGRPRRLVQPSTDSSPRTASSTSPAHSGSDSNPNVTTSDAYGRSPSQATSLSGSTNQHDSPSIGPFQPEDMPTILPLPSRTALAEAYVKEIYGWCPILPADPAKVERILEDSDALLTHAIACIVDTTRPPPICPPKTKFISLSMLQAAVLLSQRAYGVKDRAKSIELIQWVTTEIRSLGWNGHNYSKLSYQIHARDQEAFIGLGYVVWGLTIQLGVLTGDRSLLLADITMPTRIVPDNMMIHALSLLRDATDFETLWSLPEDERFQYTVDIVERSDEIQKAAVKYLDETTPNFDPSSPDTWISRTLAASRESAFLTASMAPASIILLLSSTSPLSPLVAPTLPCSLDVTSYRTGTLASLVRFAANKILNVVRTAPTREGMSVACEPHSPFWGCCFLITARGLLLGAQASQEETNRTGIADVEFNRARTEEDLDMCETILRKQASKWACCDQLVSEVGLLRRTVDIS